MTSPSVDELSPVKLPISNTPINKSLHPKHKTPDIIIHHDHGLAAKVSNRRNTIHEGRSVSLVQTPLTRIEKPQSLTTRKYNISPNLDSIRRSKLVFDTVLRPGSDKENKNPFESSPSKDSTHTSVEVSSSPIKRSRQDTGARKAPKIFTNANDLSSEQIDEVFVKEDLVGQFSNNSKAVYENGSDSEVEDYGRIESTLSQTIVPNTSGLNQTIHKMNDDYVITPQRFTEPVARSPTFSQNTRANDAMQNSDKSNKDITSPIKIRKSFPEDDDDDMIDINKLENEPTINFLLSPNSKPVFSKDEITKIESNYNKLSSELQSEILSKSKELNLVKRELVQVNEKLDKSYQEIRSMTERNAKLNTREEVLSIQLKHNERELASLTKKFKIQESAIHNLEIEKSRLVQKIEFLTNDQKDTVEKLIEEKKCILKANEESNVRNEKLEGEIANLTKEVHDLKDLTTKQEELLKELDNLEILANNKIHDLENNLQKQKEINEENVKKFNSDQDELTKKIESYVEQEEEYKKHESKLNEEIERLSSEIHEKSKLVNSLTSKIDEYDSDYEVIKQKNLEMENNLFNAKRRTDELEEKLAENKSVIKELTLQTENDAKVIDEYTIKLEECVDAITKQKNRTEELENRYLSEIEELQQDLKKTEADENNYWKKQYNQEKINSEQHIKEVAEYLHQEYKNKHEKKLRESRKQSELQISELNLVKKSLEREIELLNRKLTRSHDENKRLSDFIFQHKLQYQNQ